MDSAHTFQQYDDHALDLLDEERDYRSSSVTIAVCPAEHKTDLDTFFDILARIVARQATVQQDSQAQSAARKKAA